MKNAQLWKRILNNGVVWSGEGTDGPIAVQSRIITAPIIVDTRPRDDDAEEGMAWRFGSFSNLAVPFNRFWVEGIVIRRGRPDAQWGCLVETKAVTEKGHDLEVFAIAAPPAVQPLCFGKFPCTVSPDGRLDDAKISTQPYELYTNAQVSGEASHATTFSIVDNLFDLLQLLGCKNVGLKPNENEAQQVRRAEKRFGDTPDGYRYHTLVVRPPGAKPDTPGQDIGNMPRHVCRGHFSEYGPEFGKGLLFGKYSGRFYVPPHLKGDKAHGVVEKDYEVRS